MDKRGARTFSEVHIKKNRQEVQHLFFELHEPRITDKIWKLSTPIDADMFFIKMFERTIPTLMEGNDDGHDLTVVSTARTPACFNRFIILK